MNFFQTTPAAFPQSVPNWFPITAYLYQYLVLNHSFQFIQLVDPPQSSLLIFSMLEIKWIVAGIFLEWLAQGKKKSLKQYYPSVHNLTWILKILAVANQQSCCHVNILVLRIVLKLSSANNSPNPNPHEKMIYNSISTSVLWTGGGSEYSKLHICHYISRPSHYNKSHDIVHQCTLKKIWQIWNVELLDPT